MSILIDEKYNGELPRENQENLCIGEREKATIIGLMNKNDPPRPKGRGINQVKTKH